jgi:predicted nucleic acid-binding protein
MVGDAELRAPRLLDYELASVARTKIRRYPDREQELLSGLLDGLAMDIQRSDVGYVAVVQLALRADLSTYDASYLYLARQLNMPLITFDPRLQRAFRDLA